MNHQEELLLKRAETLIRKRQYDRARLVLEQIPDNVTAKGWLRKLNELDPEPATFEEAQSEIAEMRQELQEAEREREDAEHDREDAEHDREEAEVKLEETTRKFVRVNTALLVFLGTLVGTLLGTFADLGEAMQTVEDLRARYVFPKICIVGSDTILGSGLGASKTWADDFADLNDVRVSIDAIGSGNGVESAREGGCVNVLAMSEPMAPDQRQQLAEAGVEVTCAAEIGYDIIVFITDINNPVTVLHRNVMRSLLQGKINNWADINNSFDHPISILVREGSGTTDLVLQNIARFDSEYGTVFPEETNYSICDSNEACLDQTLSTRGSIYWASAAWMRTQPPEYLRALAILEGDESPVNPLKDEVNLENYPTKLIRPLYMYVLKSDHISEEQHQLAKAFFFYVRGVQGQKVMEQNGFYTHFNQPVDIDVPLPLGFDPPGTAGRTVCITD